MSNIPEKDFNISELQRFARSDAGKALISLLKSSGGTSLNSALEKAAKGDTAEAKKVIESLLSSQEARELLSKVGGSDGK